MQVRIGRDRLGGKSAEQDVGGAPALSFVELTPIVHGHPFGDNVEALGRRPFKRHEYRRVHRARNLDEERLHSRARPHEHAFDDEREAWHLSVMHMGMRPMSYTCP